MGSWSFKMPETRSKGRLRRPYILLPYVKKKKNAGMIPFTDMITEIFTNVYYNKNDFLSETKNHIFYYYVHRKGATTTDKEKKNEIFYLNNNIKKI